MDRKDQTRAKPRVSRKALKPNLFRTNLTFGVVQDEASKKETARQTEKEGSSPLERGQ